MQARLIVEKEVLLEKFPGKGGWTFARLDEIFLDKKNPFGWMMVCGSIDGFWIEKYHLMPMGNGSLFLPVRAEIRKKISKEVGDIVYVKLYLDEPTPEFVTDFRECLSAEGVLEIFDKQTEKFRHQNLEKVYGSKTVEVQDKNLLQLIKSLERMVE